MSRLKVIRFDVLYVDGREESVVVNAAAQVASERWRLEGRGKRGDSEGGYYSAWYASGRPGVGSDDAAKFEDWIASVAVIGRGDDSTDEGADPTQPTP